MKRGLVLSGGGALGAYEIGALEALVASGRRWDAVAGVSVGALNAAGIAMYKKKDQPKAIANLERIWSEIDSNDIVYKKHAWGWFNYIWSMWKQSLYTMQPLADLVKKEIDAPGLRKSDVECHVGICNIQNGKYYAHKINAFSPESIVDIIHASCVFPGLFEPVGLWATGRAPTGIYVDGGIRDTIPIQALPLDDLDEIDIITTAPEDGAIAHQAEFKSAIDVGLRAAFIMSDEVMITDRIQGICGHHNVKFNLYAPNAPLRYDGFEFKRDNFQTMRGLGYAQTADKLSELAFSPVVSAH